MAAFCHVTSVSTSPPRQETESGSGMLRSDLDDRRDFIFGGGIRGFTCITYLQFSDDRLVLTLR